MLDPSFSHCLFDEYQTNELSKDYCTLINVIDGKHTNYTCENNKVIEKAEILFKRLDLQKELEELNK